MARNNLDTRIKKLEQKQLPVRRYPVCFALDEDVATAVARHKKKYPESHGTPLHVVTYKRPVK